jgi:apolipoprotein N-acyltransferase
MTMAYEPQTCEQRTLTHPTSTEANRWRWFWLSIPLLLFSNGRFALAPLAWVAPLFLVRYLRLSRSAWGAIGWLYLACSAVWAFQFYKMAPLPAPLYVILSAAYGLVVALPFAIDRLLARRLSGFAATFILPMAWVFTEYALIHLSPYGSWGSIAYSQSGFDTLLQTLSLTGMLGITFLIGWFAALANWMWETIPLRRSVRGGVTIAAAVFGAVLLFGSARLRVLSDAPTVRIASLSHSDLQLFSNPDMQRRAMANERLTAAEMVVVRANSLHIFEDLLARTASESQAGARIVFWGEASAIIMREDEKAFLTLAQGVARTHAIYLGLGVGIWHQGESKPLENKIVLIDPSGSVAWQFLKARPVPPGESSISMVDDGRIRTLDTPYGRLAAAICFDMDFPQLIRQAGSKGADILLVPSNDWRDIDPWHTQMAVFRSIEEGVCLVRHASGGLSMATDAKGRVLARLDHYTSSQRAMVSVVPTHGTRTLYSRTGDAFAIVTLVGLATLVGVTRRRPPRHSGAERQRASPE